MVSWTWPDGEAFYPKVVWSVESQGLSDVGSDRLGLVGRTASRFHRPPHAWRTSMVERFRVTPNCQLHIGSVRISDLLVKRTRRLWGRLNIFTAPPSPPPPPPSPFRLPLFPSLSAPPSPSPPPHAPCKARCLPCFLAWGARVTIADSSGFASPAFHPPAGCPELHQLPFPLLFSLPSPSPSSLLPPKGLLHLHFVRLQVVHCCISCPSPLPPPQKRFASPAFRPPAGCPELHQLPSSLSSLPSSSPWRFAFRAPAGYVELHQLPLPLSSSPPPPPSPSLRPPPPPPLKVCFTCVASACRLSRAASAAPPPSSLSLSSPWRFPFRPPAGCPELHQLPRGCRQQSDAQHQTSQRLLPEILRWGPFVLEWRSHFLQSPGCIESHLRSHLFGCRGQNLQQLAVPHQSLFRHSLCRL